MEIRRNKLGRFMKGSKPWNESIPCSPETKKKLSQIHKEKYKKGYINPFFGKRHSKKVKWAISKRTKEVMKNPNIRKKISITHKGKHRSPDTEFKKGLKHSKEWKKRQSKMVGGTNNPFYGKKHSEEIKKRLSQIFSGKNNHFWKGGISPINKKLRRSLKFRKWREAVFKRDNYICRICGFSSGNGKHIDLHPHHVKFFSNFPNLRFDINNGITLCKNCHQKLHSNKFAKRQEVK